MERNGCKKGCFSHVVYHSALCSTFCWSQQECEKARVSEPCENMSTSEGGNLIWMTLMFALLDEYCLPKKQWPAVKELVQVLKHEMNFTSYLVNNWKS